jgi:hypothetical protein
MLAKWPNTGVKSLSAEVSPPGPLPHSRRSRPCGPSLLPWVLDLTFLSEEGGLRIPDGLNCRSGLNMTQQFPEREKTTFFKSPPSASFSVRYL